MFLDINKLILFINVNLLKVFYLVLHTILIRRFSLKKFSNYILFLFIQTFFFKYVLSVKRDISVIFVSIEITSISN